MWLFVKGNVFIGKRGIFGAEVFLCYRRFFVKSDFIIGRVECNILWQDVNFMPASAWREDGHHQADNCPKTHC